MEAAEKRKPGRPGGKDFPVVRKLRLTVEQAEELKALAVSAKCSEPEFLRRAFEKAKREGL